MRPSGLEQRIRDVCHIPRSMTGFSYRHDPRLPGALQDNLTLVMRDMQHERDLQKAADMKRLWQAKLNGNGHGGS